MYFLFSEYYFSLTLLIGLNVISKIKNTGTSNVCIEKLKLLSDFISIFQFPNYNIFSIEIATDLSDRARRQIILASISMGNLLTFFQCVESFQFFLCLFFLNLMIFTSQMLSPNFYLK